MMKNDVKPKYKRLAGGKYNEIRENLDQTNLEVWYDEEYIGMRSDSALSK